MQLTMQIIQDKRRSYFQCFFLFSVFWNKKLENKTFTEVFHIPRVSLVIYTVREGGCINGTLTG